MRLIRRARFTTYHPHARSTAPSRSRERRDCRWRQVPRRYARRGPFAERFPAAYFRPHWFPKLRTLPVRPWHVTRSPRRPVTPSLRPKPRRARRTVPCPRRGVAPRCVIKFIHEKYRAEPELLSQFHVEAEVTGRLDHPGVVPVYGIGQDWNGQPFYVMRHDPRPRAAAGDSGISRGGRTGEPLARTTGSSCSRCWSTWRAPATRWPTRTTWASSTAT